jgi:hypothetical protein
LLAGAQELRSWDLTNRKTDEANHNSRPYEEILRAFRKARQRIVLRFEELENAWLTATALVREDVKTIVPPGDAHSIPTEAFVQFIAGGLFGMLMWRLGGKMRLPGEELNALFRRLAIPAVRAALR